MSWRQGEGWKGMERGKGEREAQIARKTQRLILTVHRVVRTRYIVDGSSADLNPDLRSNEIGASCSRLSDLCLLQMLVFFFSIIFSHYLFRSPQSINWKTESAKNLDQPIRFVFSISNRIHPLNLFLILLLLLFLSSTPFRQSTGFPLVRSQILQRVLDPEMLAITRTTSHVFWCRWLAIFSTKRSFSGLFAWF